MKHLWNDADKVRLKYLREQLARVTLFPSSIKGLRDEESASKRLIYIYIYIIVLSPYCIQETTGFLPHSNYV